jgi:hypothetical protein
MGSKQSSRGRYAIHQHLNFRAFALQAAPHEFLIIDDMGGDMIVQLLERL